jgi:methyl-accepting chemotaxis protein PixJ
LIRIKKKAAMKFSMRHKFNSSSLPLPAQGEANPELQLRAGLGKAADRQLFSFVVVLIALFGSITYTASSYQRFSAAVKRELEFQNLTSQVQYLDEVLTMSARMSASTGDVQWQQRYNEHIPKLEQTLTTLTQIYPEDIKNQPQAVADANNRLIELENKAFQLVTKGDRVTALNVLMGSEYQAQKLIYSQGNEKTLKLMKIRLTKAELDARLGLYSGFGFTGLSVATILGLTILSLRSQKLATKKVRDQNMEFQASQVALQQLNVDLEAKGQQLELQSQKLAAQEEALRIENEILQDDIAHLLDVVSAVEEGDFTAQAEVNDRITGLVADTLNRLIEQLGRVLGEVVTASEQVTHTSADLEALAQNVAGYATEQEQGAVQVLTLTKQVQTSTQDSARQVQRSSESLQQMTMLVDKGVNELQGMTFGIEVLQSGTDRIVQQMKTLGEFVGLADQFVQEQSQVASLTQVLSLNATLVAARASEQRDPRQFAVVAREFEQIAAQVGQLAQQTSDSLGMLQQRTTNIYNAVSAIDSDIQSLGNLVQGFTQGVVSSNESFAALQTVAADVVSAGEAVTQANHDIIAAAQRTARSMGQMAQTAKQTVELTQQAESQTRSMEELSHQLFERMNFFRLPDMTTATIAMAKTIPSATAEDLALMAQVARLDFNEPGSNNNMVDIGADIPQGVSQPEPNFVTALAGQEANDGNESEPEELTIDALMAEASILDDVSQPEAAQKSSLSEKFLFDELSLDEIPSEALFSDSMMSESIFSNPEMVELSLDKNIFTDAQIEEPDSEENLFSDAQIEEPGLDESVLLAVQIVEPGLEQTIISEAPIDETSPDEGFLFDGFLTEEPFAPEDSEAVSDQVSDESELESVFAGIEDFETLEPLEPLETLKPREPLNSLETLEAKEDISVIGV